MDITPSTSCLSDAGAAREQQADGDAETLGASRSLCLPPTACTEIIKGELLHTLLDKIRPCSKDIASAFAVSIRTLKASGGFLPARAFGIYPNATALRIVGGDASATAGAGLTPAQRVTSTIAAAPSKRLRSIYIEDMGSLLSEDDAMGIVDSIISVARFSLREITFLWPLPPRAAELLQLRCRQLRSIRLCVQGAPDTSFDGLELDQLNHRVYSTSMMLCPSSLATSVDISVTPGTTLTIAAYGLEYLFTPEAVDQWKATPSLPIHTLAERRLLFGTLKHLSITGAFLVVPLRMHRLPALKTLLVHYGPSSAVRSDSFCLDYLTSTPLVDFSQHNARYGITRWRKIRSLSIKSWEGVRGLESLDELPELETLHVDNDFYRVDLADISSSAEEMRELSLRGRAIVNIGSLHDFERLESFELVVYSQADYERDRVAGPDGRVRVSGYRPGEEPAGGAGGDGGGGDGGAAGDAAQGAAADGEEAISLHGDVVDGRLQLGPSKLRMLVRLPLLRRLCLPQLAVRDGDEWAALAGAKALRNLTVASVPAAAITVPMLLLESLTLRQQQELGLAPEVQQAMLPKAQVQGQQA